jgi:hypothetical protein
LEEFESNLSKSHVQVENLTSDNQSLSERVGKSELGFAIASEAHRKKVNGLQNELSGLQDINTQKEALASDLRAQLVQNDLKYNSVESQLSSTTKNLQTRVQDLEAKISESNLTVNRKNSDLREQSDFTQEIQKSNSDLTKNLEKSKEEILQLTEVIANNEATRSELESVVASQKNEIKDSLRAFEAEQSSGVFLGNKILELEIANGKLEGEKNGILEDMDKLNCDLVEKFTELSRTIEEQNLLVSALKLDVESRDREVSALEAVIVVREAALTESGVRSISDAKLIATLNEKITISLSSEESLKSETEILGKKVKDVTGKLLEKNKAFQSLIEQQLTTTQEVSDLNSASLRQQTLLTEEKICLEEKIQRLQSQITEQVTLIETIEAETEEDKIFSEKLVERLKLDLETKNSELLTLKNDFDAKITKMTQEKVVLEVENGKLREN